MSIVAFKKKSLVQYGKKTSGNSPGGNWITQGPFGSHPVRPLYSSNGFSVSGSHRNVGYVGKTYQMSKSGTPYKGQYAKGNGGTFGKYIIAQPVTISNEVFTLGNQSHYVKPPTLSTRGMLAKRYKWIHSGTYPNYWVQPIYGGSMLSDTKSQGNYVDQIRTANLCVNDVNNTKKYEGLVRDGGPTLCKKSTAGFTYDDMARNGPYTKFLYRSVDSSVHTSQIQKKCQNPTEQQKPWPPPSNGNACNAHNKNRIDDP